MWNRSALSEENPIRDLYNKLKLMKHELIELNQKHYSKVSIRVKNMQEQLVKVQQELQQEPFKEGLSKMTEIRVC